VQAGSRQFVATMGTAAAPPGDRIRVPRSRVGQAQSGAGGVRQAAGADRRAAAGVDGLGVHAHRDSRRVGAPGPGASWGGGAFGAVVSVPLTVMMLVAMFTVHLRYGFSAINTIGLTADGPQFGPPGIEVNLLYIAGLLALVLGGAGPLSVDGLLTPRKRDPAVPPS